MKFLAPLFLLLAVCLRAQGVDPEPALSAPSGGAVQVWQTTSDGSQKLARLADLTWSTGLAAATANVTVNESIRYQQIDGFGASILDSSLWDADPAVRDEVMRLLFSRSSGIGLSTIRVPMGLSGITGPNRTYNDLPSGQTDPTLSQFSIAGDLLWKVPMMQQAKVLNPELTLMGTPWSAPAWMKTSGNLGYGKLNPSYYGVYAQYFTKWLDAWRGLGLGISAVTMQNEPHYEPYWYQGMRMEPADQISFGLQLGPALRAAGHSTRILAWDHNCDEVSYPIAVMDDTVARNWIHGAAFHAYAGTTSDIYQFTDAHPDKDVYFTEQTGSYPGLGYGGSIAWHARNIFLVPSLNGARTNLVWQLSRRMEDTLSGDRPFVRITPDGKGYELHGEFYETGQFSKFIRKGARRIDTNNPRDALTKVFNGPLLYAAYQNPDSSKVLVVLNDSGSTQSFTLEDLGVAGRRAPCSIPAGALTTFYWRDTSGGGTGLSATYFDNPDLTGQSEQRLDPVVDFIWAPETFDANANFTFAAESPLHSIGPLGFSARWEGAVLPSTSETYTFYATTNSGEGVRLWVNGQLLFDRWASPVATESSGAIALTAGQSATIKLEYYSSSVIGGGRATLSWSSTTLARQVIPQSRLFPVVANAVPPPPLGLSARAPGSGVQLSWSPAPAATSYTVKRAASAAGPFVTLISGLASTGYTDSTAVAGTSYVYTVTAVNGQGSGAASAPRAITPRGSALGSPWQQLDIGTVGLAGVGGNAGGNGGTVVLGGAGSDIWGTSDSFRFAYLPLDGDGSIVARVASLENTHEWAKIGLMIRESLGASAAFADIVITPANGVAVHARANTGASAAGTNVSGLFAPRWLKLTRVGSTFTGYHSLDGVTWTQTATPVTVTMGASAYIGLAVCSHTTSAVNLAEFDGISAPGLATPLAPAPASLDALPGNASNTLVWPATAYAANYQVSRSAVSGGPYAVLGTTGQLSYVDATAANDTTYYYIVKALNSSGAGPSSAEAFATARSTYLPSGWINLDIGTVGLAGSVSLSSGVYTVQAAGVGVWSTADGFNYSYQTVSGDGSLTVRVDSLINTNTFGAKSGPMFRTSTAANASYAYLGVTPGGGVKFEARTAAGVSAISVAGASGAAPRWLRLARTGATVTAYSSTDGATWTTLSPALTLDFPGDFLVGLAVTANNTTTRTTSVLSQLSTTGFKGPLTPANLSASAGLAGIQLDWSAVSGATSYNVKRMVTGGVTYSLVATVAAPGFLDSSVANRTAYTYVVTASNADGESAASDPASATTNLAPLPAAWSDFDLGSVGISGGADHTTGAFTVRGSGTSLTGVADSFNLCALTLSGSVTFSARVADVGTVSSTAKVGLMLRETNAADARFAYIGVSPGGTLEFRYRANAGGAVTVGATLAGQSLPRYFRLVRSGTRSRTFTASHSANGTTWTQLGSSVTIAMSTSSLGGLVVCSMDNAKLHSAVFDQVAATGFVAAATPTGLSATGSPSTVNLVWSTAASASGYRVKRATSPGGPYLNIAQTTDASYSDSSAENHVNYFYVVSSVNSLSESTVSAEVTAMRDTVTLPSGWTNADINTTGLRGSADFFSGQYFVRGGGSGIGGTADSFHFASRFYSGDGQLITRVASLDATGAGARAGLMFRESTAAGSPYVLLALTPSGGVRFEYRATAGGAAVLAATGSGAAPLWLKLIRKGDVFTAFTSLDGATWTLVGTTVTVSLPSSALAGFASTSGSLSALNTATFGSYSVSTVPPLRILVLGATQPLNVAEAAFPPAGVADELRQIMASDPALAGQTVTVTAADLYQSKSYTQTFTQVLSSRSLMSGYFWPLTRAATSALLAQGWDHVVMIDDPYVASRFPEYSFEGVRAFAREARLAGAQPSLVMTWTSAASPGTSNNTAKFAEMAYRVGAATGVPVVPAGHAWAALSAGVKGAGIRPNLQGNYTAAAAIFSHITSRAATSGSYVPAALTQPDRDTLAAAALSAVQTAPGQTQFTGAYTGPTHFASPLLKKRSFTYTDFNSSTEWGYRAGLASVLALARMDWTQTYAGYQSLPTSGFLYDFAQTRDYLDADAAKWRVFGTFDYQDDSGAESMISGVDRVMYAAPLPEQETSAANITPASITAGTFFVPVRVLWSRISTEQPSIPAQPDGHHVSDEYNQGVASMMFTLLTGRCAVGDAPADTASLAWRNWFCRKTGYEIAWQYATLQERVPGFEVLPASAATTTVTPGTSTTLTVRFLYAPTSNVTVNVAVDNALAATVSPATLIFTPQNYATAQTVTVTGLAGAAGSDNFNVTFITSSADSIFNTLSDSWAYTTLRPASGIWTANASGLWSDTTKWLGGSVANGTGSADFSTIDITADRTVALDTALTLGSLVFGDTSTATAAGWSVTNNGNAANILTLVGTTPSITVNSLASGKAAAISTVIAGTSGLAKNGNGTLALAALNTYSGNTTVNSGTLRLDIGGATGALRGALTINSNATVLSAVSSSFGFNPGTKVDTLTVNGGTLLHTPSGGTLTLSSVAINLTGGTLDSTGTGGFDFFDAQALGGPNLNTSVTTFASATSSVVAGRINLRAGDSDTTGTVFTVADGAAANDLVVSAALGNGTFQGVASVVQKSGPGRLVLSGNNSYTGGTTLNGGSLVAASTTALGGNSTLTFNAGSGLVFELATPDGSLASTYSLNMGSNRFNTVVLNRASPGSADYSLGTLFLGASTMTFNLGGNITGTGIARFATLDLSAGNNDRPVILNGNATLAFGTAAITSNPNISKRLQLDGTSLASTLGSVTNGAGTGVLSLIKAGAGRWTITGNTTYTGNTTVNGGELVLSTAGLPSTAAVFVNTGGVLNLAFTGTDIIGSLTLNGATQPAGTWGGLASSAANRTALLSGNGTFTVPGVAYSTWLATNGLALTPEQGGFNADPDADGLANSLEWILGGDPLSNTSTPAPAFTLGVNSYLFSFPRSPSSLGVGTVSAEWSTDLVTWTAVAIGATSASADSNGIIVNVTPAVGAPDTVQVVIPNSLAPAGRLFVRLKAKF